MNGVFEFLINLFGVTFVRLFLLLFVILKSLLTPTLQETYCPDYQQYDLASLLLQSYSLYDEWFLEDFGEGFYYEGITDTARGIYAVPEYSPNQYPILISQDFFRLDSIESSVEFYNKLNYGDGNKVEIDYYSELADETDIRCVGLYEGNCRWVARYGCIVTVIRTSTDSEFVTFDDFEKFVVLADERVVEILSVGNE